MSFFNIFKPAPAPASAIAPAVLPPGWQILMSGTKPYYYHAGRNITQPEFPQPEPAPEPERELPAGWKKEKRRDGYDGSKTWVEYVSTVVPGVSQYTFPTAPSRALNPFWEEFKVGDTTMYRSISNRSLVTQEFPEAKPFQIAKMWEDYHAPNKLAPGHGGKRKQSKRNQSKRNQSKRNQSKRNQSKRKQSNKSH